MRRPWRRSPPELVDLVARLPAGALAVDCGANVGDVTSALARRCAEVVAFEPNPFAFARLQQRVGRLRNVRLFQAAVGASPGVRRLFLHVDHATDPLAASSGSSLHPSKRNVSPSQWVDVDVIDLDAFLERLGRPVDLLKLDVEGAEIELLERFVATGRLATIGRVVVEMHDGIVPELAERGAALRRVLAADAYRHVELDWR